MSLDPFTAGFDLIKTALDKFFPDADEELKGKLDQAAKEIDAEVKLKLAQISVNEKEAEHPSLFVAGARPFIIWVCGFGLAYETVAMPIINGILVVLGHSAVFPSVDTGLLEVMVGGILGLGFVRSWDKRNGTATKKFGK